MNLKQENSGQTNERQQEETTLYNLPLLNTKLSKKLSHWVQKVNPLSPEWFEKARKMLIIWKVNT